MLYRTVRPSGAELRLENGGRHNHATVFPIIQFPSKLIPKIMNPGICESGFVFNQMWSSPGSDEAINVSNLISTRQRRRGEKEEILRRLDNGQGFPS